MIVIIWISSQFKLVEDWFNTRTVWSQKKPFGGSCVRTVSTARMVIIAIITNITYVMIIKIKMCVTGLIWSLIDLCSTHSSATVLEHIILVWSERRALLSPNLMRRYY